MTIVEAIKAVLSSHPDGMDYLEIYTAIIEEKLYSFGATDPQNVVRGQLRKHCDGLNFPSSSKNKYFRIIRRVNNTNYYALIDNSPIKVLPAEPYDTSDLLPEEKMQQAYLEHAALIKNQLISLIQSCSPTFFEHLVVDMLLEMGYGYDKNSGIVVGGPHDGGIDGIIYEDKLGLDLIYIQAKRYNKSVNVGRRDLQAFVGAMEKIQKGVFITTSSFTREAQKYINSQQQKSIKLIDGDMLADIMLKYGLGVKKIGELSIFKLDSDYFD